MMLGDKTAQMMPEFRMFLLTRRVKKKIDESLNNCLITFHEPCAAPFFPDFHFYFIFSSVIFLTESFIISAVAAVVGLREAVAGKWKEDEIIFICELVG